MVMCREQNVRQHYNTLINNKSIESLERFKYLGTTLTRRICIPEEIIRTCKSRILCHQRIPAIIHCKIFCLPVCYPKIWIL